MGAGGIEPPAAGLEPAILPLNYAPVILSKEFILKIYANCFISSISLEEIAAPLNLTP